MADANNSGDDPISSVFEEPWKRKMNEWLWRRVSNSKQRGPLCTRCRVYLFIIHFLLEDARENKQDAACACSESDVCEREKFQSDIMKMVRGRFKVGSPVHEDSFSFKRDVLNWLYRFWISLQRTHALSASQVPD
ncbi:hypothetical protein C0J52_16271 [Blattella germanica]|nr:hypothetical protein C0J52_16271 [Blattella germanica]